MNEHPAVQYARLRGSRAGALSSVNACPKPKKTASASQPGVSAELAAEWVGTGALRPYVVLHS